MTAAVVYRAEVRHHRHRPAHDVRQGLRLVYLDLDELPDAGPVRRRWSTRPERAAFRRRDFKTCDRLSAEAETINP